MRLVYDGTCRTCVVLARWALDHDRTGRLRIAAYQDPGVLASCGLSPAEADAEVWLVEDTGERLGGAAAINRVLFLQGGGWRLLARLFRMPVVSGLETRAYHWFSGHRHWFDRAWGPPDP